MVFSSMDKPYIYLSSQYMPSISWMALFIHSDALIDGYEHYQKMSLRNRCEIATPQGILKLSVPLLHGRNQRRPVAEVGVYREENWPALHWKSLATNYRKSPYFEFLEDQTKPFFENQETLLLELNALSLRLLLELLGLSQKEIKYTSKYHPQTTQSPYSRAIATGKIKAALPMYQQVFMEKSGFIPNMSCLDLIFCIGPQEAQSYLKESYAILRETYLNLEI